MNPSTRTALNFPGFCATDSALQSASDSGNRAEMITLSTSKGNSFDIPLPVRSEAAANDALKQIAGEIDLLLKESVDLKESFELSDNLGESISKGFKSAAISYEEQAIKLLKRVKAAGKVSKDDLVAVREIRNTFIANYKTTTLLSIGRFNLVQLPPNLLRSEKPIDSKALKLFSEQVVSQRKAINLISRVERTDLGRSKQNSVSSSIQVNSSVAAFLKKLNYIVIGFELAELVKDIVLAKTEDDRSKVLRKWAFEKGIEKSVDLAGGLITSSVVPVCIVFGPYALFCAVGVHIGGAILTHQITKEIKANQKIDLSEPVLVLKP
jgi:hypothetical protein